MLDTVEAPSVVAPKEETFEFCHKCDTDTRWVTMSRGSRREQCEGCKDVWPCRNTCDHLDCYDEKASWVKAV